MPEIPKHWSFHSPPSQSYSFKTPLFIIQGLVPIFLCPDVLEYETELLQQYVSDCFVWFFFSHQSVVRPSARHTLCKQKMSLVPYMTILTTRQTVILEKGGTPLR